MAKALSATLKRFARRVWRCVSCRPSSKDVLEVGGAAVVVADVAQTLKPPAPDSEPSSSSTPATGDEKRPLPPTPPVLVPDLEPDAAPDAPEDQEPESPQTPGPALSAHEEALEAVKAARDFAGGLPSIELQVSSFKLWSKLVVGALDAVGGVHPIVQGVAQVVKVAVQFEVRRQENDRKVLAVKVELLKMADALFDIMLIENSKVDPVYNGLRSVVQSISDDVLECSKACETYMTQSYLLKLLDGSRWDTQFLQFMQDFQARRQDLMLALGIRNANAINDVGRAVDASRMDIMAKLQEVLDAVKSPNEKQLADFIESGGGSTKFITNENSFAALQDKVAEVEQVPVPARQQEEDQDAQKAFLESIRATMNTDIKSLLQEHQEEYKRQLSAIETSIKREQKTKSRQETLIRPPELSVVPPDDGPLNDEPVSPATSTGSRTSGSGYSASGIVESLTTAGRVSAGYLSTVYNAAMSASQEAIARVPVAGQQVASIGAATGKAVYRLAAASQEAVDRAPAPEFEHSDNADDMPGGWSAPVEGSGNWRRSDGTGSSSSGR